MIKCKPQAFPIEPFSFLLRSEKRKIISLFWMFPKGWFRFLWINQRGSKNNLCDRELKIMGAVQGEEKGLRWLGLTFLGYFSANAQEQILIIATVANWLWHENRQLIFTLWNGALVENERELDCMQSGPAVVLIFIRKHYKDLRKIHKA